MRLLHWNALAAAEIEDYWTLRNQLNGEPQWTVTQTSGQTLPITWNVDMDGARADVRLEAQDLVDQNIQPGNAEIKITCSWGGLYAEAITEVNLTELPNGMPIGINYNNGSDVVECQIGDTLDILPTILPSNWEIPGYTPAYIWNSGEFERFCDVVEEGDWGRKLTVREAGIYQCLVGVGIDTVMVGRWITYRVKDQDGNIPTVEPRINTQYGLEWTYFIGTDFIEGSYETGKPQSEPQLAFVYIENEDACRLQFSGNPEFTVTSDKETSGFKVEPISETSFSLNLKYIPSQATDVTYTVAVDWDDTHTEQDLLVHYVPAPSLPTGIEFGFKDPMIVQSGEKIPLNAWFKNGWLIPGYEPEVYLGGGNNIWEGIDEYTWCAATPGVYDANMSVHSANIYWVENYTLVVTKADGTMSKSDYQPFGNIMKLPAGTTVIESEAFANTTFTEIDIPAGVSIADDAFKDSSLIAIYAHDQDTIDYAVSHGMVAVVDN